MDIGHLNEPLLQFGMDQCAHDPRDGLELFGPIKDNLLPKEIRVGVVGTKRGIEVFNSWLKRVNHPIDALKKDAINQRSYLGFEAIFDVSLPTTPNHRVIVDEDQIEAAINVSDPHIRANKAVDIYVDALKTFRNQNVDTATFWFVVVPDSLATQCRPNFSVSKDARTDQKFGLVAKMSADRRKQRLLFEEDRDVEDAFDFAPDFHDQFKARLLKDKVITQLMKESTLRPYDDLDSETGAPAKREHDAEVAWNATTTALYKSGANVWRLAGVRPGVCYIGLVFKQDKANQDKKYACCGAQMFLDSAEGLVFRGALGPWYSEENDEYHLSESEAKKLGQKIITEYKILTGNVPSEVFIHGRARLNQDEWRGFRAGCPRESKLFSVTIKESKSLKLFRSGKYPILRGTYLYVHGRKAFLFTRGFTPGLGTYIGKETPNPLDITLDFGDTDIHQILEDVMGLTKLNFNQSKYADGKPVTLRFAERVGRVMVASKELQEETLPFRHYI